MVIPERVTPSGRVLAEAKLHCGLGFEKMFDVFDYSGYDEKGIREMLMPKRKAISENVSLIVGEGTTDIFSMYEISGDAEFELSSEFAVMVVVEGEAYIDGELYRKGETLFVKDEKKLSFKGENFAVALCE